MVKTLCFDQFCFDGAGVAYAHHQHDPDTLLLPLSHGNQAARQKVFSSAPEGSELYFGDISPTPQELRGLMLSGKFRSITIWDHHVSVQTDYAGFTPPPGRHMPELSIDIDPAEPSAAGMAWKKLFPGKAMPDIFQYVARMEPQGTLRNNGQDYPIAAHMDSHSIATPDDIIKSFNRLATQDAGFMIENGAPIHLKNCMEVDRLAGSVRYTTAEIEPGVFATIPVFNGNVRQYGRIANRFLNEFSRNDWHCPGVALMYYEKDEKIFASVRTTGGKSAAKAVKLWLEQKLGLSGGGHDNAAVAVFEKAAFSEHFPLYTKGEICKILSGDNERLRIPVRPRIRYIDSVYEQFPALRIAA